MKYLHKFETNCEFLDAYEGQDYIQPWVSYTSQNQEVNYNKGDGHEYSLDYFTIEMIEDGELHLGRMVYGDNYPTIIEGFEYNINDGGWEFISTAWTGSYRRLSPAIEVNAGDKIKFRGQGAYATDWYYNNDTRQLSGAFFDSTGKYKVYGNYMSLYYGSGYTDCSLDLNDIQYFGKVSFSNCQGGYNYELVDAYNLVIPATALTFGAYGRDGAMFGNCYELVRGPRTLPATVLDEYCYENMFEGCIKLVESPILPAEVLAPHCYESMFRGCASLEKITMLGKEGAEYALETWACCSAEVYNPDMNTSQVYWFSEQGTLVVNNDFDSLSDYTSLGSRYPEGWDVETRCGDYLGTLTVAI